MRKSRFTEEQIVGILKAHEAGTPTAELLRQHGIARETFYRWRAKYVARPHGYGRAWSPPCLRGTHGVSPRCPPDHRSLVATTSTMAAAGSGRSPGVVTSSV